MIRTTKRNTMFPFCPQLYFRCFGLQLYSHWPFWVDIIRGADQNFWRIQFPVSVACVSYMPRPSPENASGLRPGMMICKRSEMCIPLQQDASTYILFRYDLYFPRLQMPSSKEEDNMLQKYRNKTLESEPKTERLSATDLWVFVMHDYCPSAVGWWNTVPFQCAWYSLLLYLAVCRVLQLMEKEKRQQHVPQSVSVSASITV